MNKWKFLVTAAMTLGLVAVALFVVAVTISTVSSCLGAIADDLNEDKG